MSLPFAYLDVPNAAALLAAGPGIADALILPESVLDQPWAPGKAWTVGEMAWHLADVESAMLDRVRRVLAMDEPVLPSIPEDLWVRYLPRRPIATAAPWFTANRTVLGDLVRNLPPGALARRGAHPEFGAMTLADILRHLHGHALHHAAQLSPWRQSTPAC